MENNKHSKFDNLIKNQFENHEVDYNHDDWKDFEQKFQDQLPSQKSTINNFVKKIDFKTAFIISLLFTNLILVLFFIYYLENDKSSLSQSFYNEMNKPVKRKYKISDTIVKMQFSNNEDEINDLKKRFLELENIYTKYLYLSDKYNVEDINSVVDLSDKTVEIDCVYTENNNSKEGYLNEIIKYQDDTTGLFSIIVADKKPMYKDKKGNFHYIEDLPGYINSEFQPSNIDKMSTGKFSVYLMFTISKEGEIINVEKLRAINEEVENEAIRILKGMSQWQPGEIDGNKIDIITSITIHIEIKNNTPFPNF